MSDEAELEPETPGSELFSMIKDPILDADYKSVHKRDVMLRHRCGADDTCQSDVHVNGTIPEEVTIGSFVRRFYGIKLKLVQWSLRQKFRT